MRRLPAAARGLAGIVGWLQRAWQFFITQSFSSLTRRIVFLNVAGLLALSIGINFLSEFRAGLIDARVQSLLVQGQIIAGAIAASATVETDLSLTIDPDKLLELHPGESYGPSEEALYGIDFPINPERVAPVLRRLVSPTKTRARIYDRDGVLLVDSRNLFGRGDVLRFDLPPPNAEKPGFFERGFHRGAALAWTRRSSALSRARRANGRGYPEVAQALSGQNSSVVRINDRGDVIVSVAVPVQRFRAVRGALMLSTQGADIDDMVEAERLAILKVFLVATAVMVVLSILLAGTIAEPVRRLADAAESVRRRIRARVEIPDFTRRRDEIGHLSGTLRDMTNALYSRIEAIESFAADVAHELKNPLTSMRSAVETLPLARTEESRGRLLNIIQHDVQRLNRLITDISDASRLDAELQRQEAVPVDFTKLLNTLVSVANEVNRDDGVKVTLRFEGGTSPRAFELPGHDSRLGQVVDNLIENARSFSPPAARCASPAGGSRRISKSWSTTTAPACSRTPSRKCSSASTPTVRIKVSAKIPVSASPFPSRLSTPMAGRSGWKTGPVRRTNKVSDRHRRALHCSAASAAMTSAAGDGARIRRPGRRPRRADPRPIRIGKIQACPGPDGNRASEGVFARLVADDRVHLEVAHGRLLVRPAEALAGLIEVRGVGLMRLPHEPCAVVGLVVDLAAADAERLPEASARSVEVQGVALSRLAVASGMSALQPVLTFINSPRAAGSEPALGSQRAQRLVAQPERLLLARRGGLVTLGRLGLPLRSPLFKRHAAAPPNASER